MQISKINLIEYVQGFFVDTNTDPELSEKFNPDDIAICISRNWSEMVALKVLIAKANHSWQFLDTYTKTYTNIAMTLDASRRQYYSLLPAQVMDIPGGEGIRMVCPMIKLLDKKMRTSSQDDTLIYVPAYADEKYPMVYRSGTSKWGNTDVQQVLTGTRYTPENDRVYFTFNTPENPEICDVMMKLVVPFSEYDDDDIIPEPFVKFDERGNPEGDLLDRVFKDFGIKAQVAGSKQNLGNPEPISKGK